MATVPGLNLPAPAGDGPLQQFLTVDAIRMVRQLGMGVGAPARTFATASSTYAGWMKQFAQGTCAKLVLTMAEGGASAHDVALLWADPLLAPFVAAIQGWNEPDKADHSPGRYAAIKAAQDVIWAQVRSHATLNNVKVLGPSFAPSTGGTPGDAGDYSANCDAGAANLYYSPKSDAPSGAHNVFVNKLAAFAAATYGGKGYWVTEFGMFTPDGADPNACDPSVLASDLKSVWATLKAKSPNMPLLVFWLNDLAPFTYGQFDSAYAPKGSILGTPRFWQ